MENFAMASIMFLISAILIYGLHFLAIYKSGYKYNSIYIYNFNYNQKFNELSLRLDNLTTVLEFLSNNPAKKAACNWWLGELEEAQKMLEILHQEHGKVNYKAKQKINSLFTNLIYFLLNNQEILID